MSADLDNDGDAERILVTADHGRLIVTDGPVVYTSREKWRIVEAFLGDTDGNGLLEVTALLESAEGRHIGLFAWMGDRYRERLVTSPLTPRPLSLRVDPARPGDSAGVPYESAGPNPDLVVLKEEIPAAGVSSSGNSPPANASTMVETTYRWNGFGFTAITRVEP